MHKDAVRLTVALTGAAGSVRSTRPILGEIEKILISYGGCTGTPTLTIVTDPSQIETNPALKWPAETVLNLATQNTDRIVYPRRAAQDNTGADLLYASAGQIVPVRYFVDEYLKMSITGGTAGFTIDAWVWIV